MGQHLGVTLALNCRLCNRGSGCESRRDWKDTEPIPEVFLPLGSANSQQKPPQELGGWEGPTPRPTVAASAELGLRGEAGRKGPHPLTSSTSELCDFL